MTLAIETTRLAKSYGSVQAVVDLDLEVEPGQVFAFLGPNGAGKSTTIRMLLALQRPSSGRAVLLGHDAQRDQREVHRRVAYLPGDLALYPRLTGRQHVEWFAHARGADLTAAADLAKRFDATLDRPVRELSKGNRQKIGLVMTFMWGAELLVLDEPTTGLDPLMQVEFERLVKETVARGGTVFLSSHELDEVQRLADRVAIIRQGHLVACDTVAGLSRSAPRRIEARFAQPLPASVFASLPGAHVVEAGGAHVILEVTGPIGPVLRVVADNDPVDVVASHAGLDELFMSFYEDYEQDGANQRDVGAAAGEGGR